MKHKKVMELSYSLQKYDWGKVGLESKVATLYKNSHPNFVVEKTTPYAEMWLGTHVNGPSTIKSTGEVLSTVINNCSDYLGAKVVKTFGKELPFLLKILSIRKALSIQVHPSKQHAMELHARHPDLYKDSNHKPELAVALTPFEALCGFRPLVEIQDFFIKIPELDEAVGSLLAEQLKTDHSLDTLKNCFKALMTCNDETIGILLKKAIERMSTLGVAKRRAQLAELMERLHKQFPNDVGCFAIYFLNVINLKPNEAIYLAANEPHAYLSGDCVECMACSDNVVRAGLTPKFKDVETLCSMLNYNGEHVQLKLFKPISENEYTEIYKPPVPDFALAKVEIPSGVAKCDLIKRESASILLVVNGTAVVEDISVQSGSAIFIAANKSVKFKTVSANFLAFQAMANV